RGSGNDWGEFTAPRLQLSTSTCFPLQFPELGVLDERVIGIEAGQDQARHAVQETGPAEIHLGEGEAWVGHQLVRPEPSALLDHATRHEVRVSIRFGQVMVEVSEGVLQHVLLEITGPSFEIKTLMDDLFTIAHPILMEQLRLPVVRIPAGVPDPSS